MFTVPPSDGFTEIGVVDVTAGVGVTDDVGDFRDQIRPLVCKAGGDAAIAFANGNGIYIKATILKRVAPPEQPTEAAAAVAPEQDVGCHFDTQCKGNRVCDDGHCVEPAEPATTAVGTATPLDKSKPTDSATSPRPSTLDFKASTPAQ